MIFRDPADASPLRVPTLVTAVALATVALIVTFVLPNPFARLADLSTLVGVGS